MKYLIFLVLAILFICDLNMIYSGAYTIKMFRDMSDDTQCRQWIEDASGNQIAGDNHNHGCYTTGKNPCTDQYNVNVTYTIHARVVASIRKGKTRGPFSGDACYRLSGTVFKWYMNPCNEQENGYPSCNR